MGPVSAQTYLSRRWSPPAHRPHQEADYGRRGKCWGFGAFEPKTGQAFTTTAQVRDSQHFVAFLEQMVRQWPSGELFVILDNLSIHRTLEVRLWLLAHPRVRLLFQPTYAPWLNLIEPWWKTLRSLALKGRRVEQAEHLVAAIHQATGYWNDPRKPYTWRKAA
jgi:transposase